MLVSKKKINFTSHLALPADRLQVALNRRLCTHTCAHTPVHSTLAGHTLHIHMAHT